MPVVGDSKSQFAPTDGIELPKNVGFTVDADGSLNCKLRVDSVASIIVVKAGVHYPYDIKEALSTSTIGVALVTVYFPSLVRDWASPNI